MPKAYSYIKVPGLRGPPSMSKYQVSLLLPWQFCNCWLLDLLLPFQRTSSILQEILCHLMSSDVMQVHRGFYEAAKILYDQYLPLVEEHLASDPFAKIVFTVSRQSLTCIATISWNVVTPLVKSECVMIIVLWPSWWWPENFNSQETRSEQCCERKASERNAQSSQKKSIPLSCTQGGIM